MPRTILLADDSITIQKIVNLTFSGEGIDVVTVGNGDAALKKIHEIRPDLVLADIFMPGKNGYEVCEHIRKEPALRSTPVILLVGAFEPFDSSEATRVKADGHLTKPFEIKVLISAVNSLINASEEKREELKPSVDGSEGNRPQSISFEPPTEERSHVFAPLPEMPHIVPSEPAPELEADLSAISLDTLIEPTASIPLGTPLQEPEVTKQWAIESLLRAETTDSSEDSKTSPAPPAVHREALPTLSAAVPVAIEESDPLGLMFGDAALATVNTTDVSLDNKSLVVDIWETRPSLVAEPRLETAESAVAPHRIGIFDSQVPVAVPSAVLSQTVEALPSTAEVTEVFEQIAIDKPELVETTHAPISPAATASGDPLQMMNSEELVERIANRVVEKLSREVIERIAWEVIPDLAELMIKEQVEAHFKASQQP